MGPAIGLSDGGPELRRCSFFACQVNGTWPQGYLTSKHITKTFDKLAVPGTLHVLSCSLTIRP
ncbi:hypothetical protein MPL1032_220104 [Mesorhizobium plurifarium]|uniref:Uncharacterized protein n=1 Tax=Mesorhizobium plurifarium TaxID=69974 RepID=A0A0K2VYZ4_MESPL|nr:hypothetical protein MPL1032_220104 [Mesorhizobium plurifarium]